MRIGMIGLGRMGANIVRRLLKAAHECVELAVIERDRIDVPVLGPRTLRTAGDVVGHPEEQVEAIRADPSIDTAERARLIGGLANVALRAIEMAQGNARVKAIERVLKLRLENAR